MELFESSVRQTEVYVDCFSCIDPNSLTLLIHGLKDVYKSQDILKQCSTENIHF